MQDETISYESDEPEMFQIINSYSKHSSYNLEDDKNTSASNNNNMVKCIPLDTSDAEKISNWLRYIINYL